MSAAGSGLEETLLDLQAEVDKSRGLAPRPPAEETARRLERARQALRDRDLDALLIFGSAGANPEPARYLAGYVHVFPSASSFVLIPMDGDPVLLIDQSWHVSEARKMSWVEDVRVFPNGNRRWRYGELQRVLRDVLVGAGLERARVGILDVETPVVYRNALSEALPKIELTDGKPAWEHLVATPSEYDQGMIERTCRLGDIGHAAAVEASRAGAMEYEVCFAAYQAMVGSGAEFLHGSGVSTHVNIGSHSEAISNVRPFLFTTNRLERGQMFWFDLTASYAGYYNDCCRTIAIGEPSAEQRRIYDVCAEMYRAIFEAVRPGVAGGDLWDIGYRVAEDAGYADVVNHVYFGHTTGIVTSCRPVIAHGEPEQIRAGSFLNIEPGVFVPGVGSSSLENMLRVTEEGAESVNRFSIDLHVR